MSQEDKLKEAKRLYETANADQRYVLESLFPELKESEDERTRKEIITYLSTVEDKELISYESWVAWLEKQAEQKPVEWSEYDEHKIKNIIYFLKSANKHYISEVEIDACVRWLWSLLQRMGLKKK